MNRRKAPSLISLLRPVRLRWRGKRQPLTCNPLPKGERKKERGRW